MGDFTFTADNLRVLIISLLSGLASFYAPTGNVLVALCVMFIFNIFAGMRADGVSVKNCKTFSIKKFGQALYELLLYIMIIYSLYTVVAKMGDLETATIITKSMTYIFCYVYMQNAFKNLISAYPKNIALRLIYHLIRFEFARALPSHLQPIVDRLNQEFKDDPNKAEKTKGKKTKKEEKPES